MSPVGKSKTDDQRHVEIVENGVFAERTKGRGGPNTVQGKGREATKMTRFSRAMGMGERERVEIGTRGTSMQLSIRFDNKSMFVRITIHIHAHSHSVLSKSECPASSSSCLNNEYRLTK